MQMLVKYTKKATGCKANVAHLHHKTETKWLHNIQDDPKCCFCPVKVDVSWRDYIPEERSGSEMSLTSWKIQKNCCDNAPEKPQRVSWICASCVQKSIQVGVTTLLRNLDRLFNAGNSHSKHVFCCHRRDVFSCHCMDPLQNHHSRALAWVQR